MMNASLVWSLSLRDSFVCFLRVCVVVVFLFLFFFSDIYRSLQLSFCCMELAFNFTLYIIIVMIFHISWVLWEFRVPEESKLTLKPILGVGA